VMEEHQGAEGARGTEGGGREGTGRSCRALWAAGRTWALSLREAGAMEGCGWRREGLTQCSPCPLEAGGGQALVVGGTEPGQWLEVCTLGA
jgi:hypothetical protein